MPKQKLSPETRQYIEERGRSFHNDELSEKFDIVSPSYIKQLQSGVKKSPTVKSEAQRLNGHKGADARWHPNKEVQGKQRRYPTLSIDKQRHNYQRWKDSSIYAHWKEWGYSLREGECLTIITRSNIECKIIRAFIRGRNDEKEDECGYTVGGKFEPRYNRVTIVTIPTYPATWIQHDPFDRYEVAALQMGTCRTILFSELNEWKCLSVAISRFNAKRSKERGYRIGAEYARSDKQRATIFTISIGNENVKHT